MTAQRLPRSAPGKRDPSHPSAPESWRRFRSPAKWLLGAAILAFALLPLCWRLLANSEKQHVDRLTRQAVHAMSEDMVSDLADRLDDVQHLAWVTSLRHLPSAREWESVSLSFLEHHAGWTAVEFISPDYSVLQHVTPNAGRRYPGVGSLEDPAQVALLETTRRTRQETVSAVEVLPSGSMQIRIVVPVLADSEFRGFVMATANLQTALADIVGDASGMGYAVAVRESSGRELYAKRGDRGELERDWSQTAEVNIHGLKWTIRAWPTPELMAELRSSLPEITLVLGTALSGLLFVTLHFVFASQRHLKEVEEANENLQKAEVELLRAREDLERRVQQRTAELEDSKRSLETEVAERKQAEDMLRQLSGRLLHLQDEERRRVARELHDSSAQYLAALALSISTVQQGAAALSPVMRDHLAEALDLVERCSTEIRTMSYLLHPPLLDDLGLVSALQWYVEGFANRSGTAVDMEVVPELGRLPAEIERTLFRIVQECLTNIRRHSRARSAAVRLTFDDGDERKVRLEVSDDGCGMNGSIRRTNDGGVPPVGVGIAGMRERVRQLGGIFRIASSPDGTTVTAVLPFDVLGIARENADEAVEQAVPETDTRI